MGVLLAAGLIALAGCGTDADGSGDPATPTPTSQAASTPTGTTTAAPDLTVRPGAVGAAKAGMTKTEALATGLFDADVEVDAPEGCGQVQALAWKTPQRSALDVLTSKNGSVVSIGVRGDGPRTADGIGVGSTLQEVSAVYETAEMTEAGYGQTGVFVTDGDAWLGLLFDADLDTIEPTAKVTFMEVTTGTRPDLIRDGC